MKRFAYLLVLQIAALLTMHAAHAADFSVDATSNWKQVDHDGDLTVYQGARVKEREFISTHVYPRRVENPNFQADLVGKKADLTFVRSAYFKQFGITEYAVSSIKKVLLPDSHFKYMQVVQASYLDIKHHVVQVVERQYMSHDKMYVVTYSVDNASISDRPHVETELDRFTPASLHDREPASEVVTATTATTVTTAAPAAPAVEEAAEPADAQLDMKLPENQKRCESVPEDKRRTAFEPTFANVIKNNISTGVGCLKGGWGSFLNILQAGKFALWDAPWAVAKYALGYKFDTYREFHDQVNATVGTLATEIQKSPSEFGMRVVTGLKNEIVKGVGDFFNCYSSAEQMRIICQVAADTVTGGLALKLITKVPLAAKETLNLFNSARKYVVGVMKPAEKAVATTVAKETVKESAEVAASAAKKLLFEAEFKGIYSKLTADEMAQLDLILKSGGEQAVHDLHVLESHDMLGAIKGMLNKFPVGADDAKRTEFIAKLHSVAEASSKGQLDAELFGAKPLPRPEPALKADVAHSYYGVISADDIPVLLTKADVEARAESARQGVLQSSWKRTLSDKQEKQLGKALTDATTKKDYEQISSRLIEISKNKNSTLPPAVQDRFMRSVSKAYSNLGPNERINSNFYQEILDRAAKAKPGSAEAKTALKDLENQTLILRMINGQTGATLRDKVDGFFAKVSAKINRVTPDEVRSYKNCFVGNRSVSEIDFSRAENVCWLPVLSNTKAL